MSWPRISKYYLYRFLIRFDASIATSTVTLFTNILIHMAQKKTLPERLLHLEELFNSECFNTVVVQLQAGVAQGKAMATERRAGEYRASSGSIPQLMIRVIPMTSPSPFFQGSIPS